MVLPSKASKWVNDGSTFVETTGIFSSGSQVEAPRSAVWRAAGDDVQDHRRPQASPMVRALGGSMGRGDLFNDRQHRADVYATARNIDQPMSSGYSKKRRRLVTSGMLPNPSLALRRRG